MRRAKIVATLGPATSSYENIRAIIDAGVDVARMNLSHGSYAVHEEVYANVRRASAESGRAVGVLVDLQGPKIRLGKFENGPYDLAVGDVFTITTEDIVGNKSISSTTYKGLPDDVKPGDPLLIDDGKVTLRVTGTDGTAVTTVVEVPGAVSNNKGINLPGVAVNVPALSEKDEADLRWGLRLGADLIALSFVRNADDIVRVHEIMAEEGRRVPVVAKIEKPQAVDNLEAIIDAFDAIMVARGDLGVELPLEAVPIVQKHAIEIARRMAKPVIVATQMLESMISSPRPTRAETSDVANAVLDGADAVMLSGETSVGSFPVVTVQTMARIIESTENHGLERIPALGTKPRTQGGAVTLAAAEVAVFVEAKYLCVFTESGDSVRRMSRLRSSIPLVALTPEESIRRRMALVWGVQTYLVERVLNTDKIFKLVDDVFLGEELVEAGEKVMVVAGFPPGTSGSTNDMRVYHVGDAHSGIAPAYRDVSHAEAHTLPRVARPNAREGAPVFDAHFHIVDTRFPLIENDGYLPPAFPVSDYRSRVAELGVVGGVVVSGSFQGFDQTYLLSALRALGPGFVGVTQLPASVTDEEILRLSAKGVRAVRFNLRRGGSETVDQLETLARRVHELAGWHTELYVDARDLPDLFDVLSSLPSVSVDHLGLSEEGLPDLLRLVEKGIRVKATGFGRVELDVPKALSAVAGVNPKALMFGSDLPSTRARRPFRDTDLNIIADALGADLLPLVLYDNAMEFYRMNAPVTPRVP